MLRHLVFICRAVIVALLLCVCVSWAGGIFEVKRYIGIDIEAITDIRFYKLPKNSADVLFFGSSHCLAAFLPQELYNSFGITSYNLSTGQQPLIVSYFWLEEALKTQSPSVVILDVYNSTAGRVGKETEVMIHKSLDHMRWGVTKVRAVNAVRKAYRYPITEYYFPNIRYHDKWKKLEKWDFSLEEMASGYKLMEYASAYVGGNKFKYAPYEEGSSSEEWKMPSVVREYLEKTANLCAKNNIKLILVKTPTTSFDIKKHNTIKRFAEEHKIPFYDTNERTLYEETSINFNTDIADYGHSNYHGALKLTHYIGKLLQTEYGLTSHKSVFWEMTKEEGENFVDDYALKETTDLGKYLSLLEKGKSRYTIFLSVKDEASKSFGTSAQSTLKLLGLKSGWKNAYRKSYIAVIENGEVIYENMSDKKLSRKCSFDKKRFICQIESAGYDCGNYSSIKIDGVEKSKNKRGLNIVVFSNDRHIIIDSVCFDTFVADNKCYH